MRRRAALSAALLAITACSSEPGERAHVQLTYRLDSTNTTVPGL